MTFEDPLRLKGEFLVVQYPTLEELRNAVIGQMRNGYTPVGDVSFARHVESPGYLMRVTMVRYDLNAILETVRQTKTENEMTQKEMVQQFLERAKSGDGFGAKKTVGNLLRLDASAGGLSEDEGMSAEVAELEKLAKGDCSCEAADGSCKLDSFSVTPIGDDEGITGTEVKAKFGSVGDAIKEVNPNTILALVSVILQLIAEWRKPKV